MSKQVWIDSDGNLTGDRHLVDLFYDIGAGMCNAQKLAETIKPDSTFDIDKVKNYIPKTKLSNMINKILKESNYRKGYEWEYDREFVSDGVHIKVIKYDINTSDWCIVKIDGVKKRLAKKRLKEQWKNK